MKCLMMRQNTEILRYIDICNKELNWNNRASENTHSALLASLYCQCEFLKSELQEKNVIIRSLTIRDSYLNDEDANRDSLNSKNICSSSDCSSSQSDEDDSVFNLDTSYYDTASESADDKNFRDLYEQYVEFEMLEKEKKLKITDKLNQQLSHIRAEKHTEYAILSGNINDENKEKPFKIDRGINGTLSNLLPTSHNLKIDKSWCNSDEVIINPHKWPSNTILIATDSIFNQIDEKRLSKQYNVKVRAFSGASVQDMYWYLHPLLAKEPDYILLHVGSNNCGVESPDKFYPTY